MDGLVKSEQHMERRMQRAVLHGYRVDHSSHLCERQRSTRPRLARGVSAHACRHRLHDVSARECQCSACVESRV